MSIGTFLSKIYGDMSPAQESVIFNESDLYINFDIWKKEKYKNVLFITGLSGSGKSTLAEKIEIKYGAEMFELDGFEGNYDSSRSNFLEKYKKINPKLGEMIENREFLKLPDEEKFEEYKKFIHWLIAEMHSNPTILYIVEGMVIYSLNPNSLKNYPIIIKGSSFLTSSIRRLRRGGGGHIKVEDLYNEIFTQHLRRPIYDFKDSRHLTQFKKEIKKQE